LIDLKLGDCLEVMQTIADKSVDLILCDLPYGTTACKWDSVIPFEPLWAQYRRIAKPNTAIVLTASQPFTTALIASNLKDFRYCWVWNKKKATGHLMAKKQPMRLTEDVAVFCQKTPIYNPQYSFGEPYKGTSRANSGEVWGGVGGKRNDNDGRRYPKNLIEFSFEHKPVHPTQKPVALMEYLIRTYTNEGDTVLDNCMGSGTTGVACANTGRKFIGIERDPSYFAIATNRIAGAQSLEAA
jgi:site-specific DNA-methyltransferase (adenine-specific)